MAAAEIFHSVYKQLQDFIQFFMLKGSASCNVEPVEDRMRYRHVECKRKTHFYSYTVGAFSN